MNEAFQAVCDFCRDYPAARRAFDTITGSLRVVCSEF